MLIEVSRSPQAGNLTSVDGLSLETGYYRADPGTPVSDDMRCTRSSDPYRMSFRVVECIRTMWSTGDLGLICVKGSLIV